MPEVRVPCLVDVGDRGGVFTGVRVGIGERPCHARNDQTGFERGNRKKNSARHVQSKVNGSVEAEFPKLSLDWTCAVGIANYRIL